MACYRGNQAIPDAIAECCNGCHQYLSHYRGIRRYKLAEQRQEKYGNLGIQERDQKAVNCRLFQAQLLL